MEKITDCKVGIVDDHVLMQEGLKMLIERIDGVSCAWCARTATQAVARLSEHCTDLLLVDISLPDRSGLELVRDLHVTNPRLKMLVVSMHDELLYAERALKAGARGYIMKDSDIDAFERALVAVKDGGVALSRKMSDRLLMAYSAGSRPSSDCGIHLLSDREFEVFQLLGEGKSTIGIGAILGISSKTVDVHRRNIKKKLELESGVDVVRFAIRWMEAGNHGIEVRQTSLKGMVNPAYGNRV